MKRNEKRSSEHRNGRRCPHTQDMFGGVGGRQAKPSPQPGGGGYQNICTVLNFNASAAEKKRDPRLEELRQMGLQSVWLQVAEEIGVDAFLRMWRIVDSDEINIIRRIGDDGRLLVPMRAYKTFLRFQRNRYIETLSEMGLSPRQIQALLKSQLCEPISIRHISRITQKD